MTGNHFVTTTATAALCPRCLNLTLIGISEGLTARVDTLELAPAAEVEALLAGRQTYTLTRGGELVHRDADRITSGLAGVTLGAHNCPRTPTEHPPF